MSRRVCRAAWRRRDNLLPNQRRRRVRRHHVLERHGLTGILLQQPHTDRNHAQRPQTFARTGGNSRRHGLHGVFERDEGGLFQTGAVAVAQSMIE